MVALSWGNTGFFGSNPDQFRSHPAGQVTTRLIYECLLWHRAVGFFSGVRPMACLYARDSLLIERL